MPEKDSYSNNKNLFSANLTYKNWLMFCRQDYNNTNPKNQEFLSN